ncbi:MAG: hypothetical protein K1X88_03045 [Nannocystaceae bacterium]|nr:hypothetical protein [Nannocystaceae bacterium]
MSAQDEPRTETAQSGASTPAATQSSAAAATESDAGGAAAAAAARGTAATLEPEAARARARGGLFARVRWWWILLAALVIEFYVYGSRGHIEVCVGKQGETDFALVGKDRTDDNRWKFPRCEAATNLGLVSKYEQATKEATSVACRGATIFRHQGEGKQCVAGSDGWQHRVQTRHAMPWDKAFYQHLLWFLF